MEYYDNLWWLLTDLVGIFRNGVEILRDIAKIVWTSVKYHRNDMKIIWIIVKICDVVNILWTSSHRSSHRCENHRENHKNLCFPRKSMVHTGVNTPWELRENSVGSPSCENNVQWCKILRKYCELLWEWCGNFGKTPRNNLKILCNDEEILWTVRNIGKIIIK